MHEQEPMTQTMSTSAASRALPELVQKVSRQETRVVVQEDGKPVAALISADDLARLNELDAQRKRAGSVFDEIHARNAHVDPEEVDRDVAEALADVRAQERARRERDAAQ
jgi:prevent-host-death family protein